MAEPVAASEPNSSVLFAAPHITDDDIDAVTRVLRTGWITTGSECLLLEEELSDYLGVPHVVGVSSCTAALEIALAHLDLPAGSKVGVPTWTFVSSALAAVHNNLTPVLLDVDPDTLNLSPASLTQAAAGLDAVVGVHFAGNALSKEIHDICTEARLPLVEDCAHSLGTSDHRGHAAGQGSAGACFSFYATKNLTSGEGGALATDDDDLADFARSYRLHGLSKDAWARYRPDGTAGYDVVAPGIKANLPDVLAALARSQLARFGELQARRRAIVERYRAGLGEVAGLRFVPRDLDDEGADHLAVVLLPHGTDRAVVVDRLRLDGIGTSVHFQPLHTFGWFEANAEIGPGGVTVADAVAPRALSLPLHPSLTDTQVDTVIERLIAALAA